MTFNKKTTATCTNPKKNSKPGTSHNRPASARSRFFSPSKRRVDKKFDPSLFIKKVEEQVVAETYTPKHTFADFSIDALIKENISAKGYVKPTPIQDQTIPALLEGKDVIGTANTGTGKTAAFLIPLINNVVTKKIARVLIIAPTRELAHQIDSEFKTFAAHTGLFSVVCIGGLSTYTQAKELRHDPDFVIGTPGRLIDLEKNNAINFNKFNAIVLDEVDTMLDMGFINDIKSIISKLPKQRQSLFFSATIPPVLKGVMNAFLHNPISVSVKTRQSSENVNQDVVRVAQANKVEVLHDLLIKPEYKKSIIFMRTKHSADRLAKKLKERGFDIAAIHGDKTQAQRSKALALFKDNKVKILIATDVVARGIDIDDVSHVINFDLPQTHEDYIHRIGRTGRAGKLGQAITFVE